MNAEDVTRALNEHLRAQLALAEGIRVRARAARDPRLRCAWTRHFVRISNAMAATGSAMARLKWAPGVAALALPALRLPALPPLPQEGGLPPAEIRKTTSSGICSQISGLAGRRFK